MAVAGNFPSEMVLAKKAQIKENGAGTYNFDVFVPAGAMILDIQVSADALWAAGTSAALVCGDYAMHATTPGAIGTVIDADGFIKSVDLKATALLATESIGINGTEVQGGLGGDYALVGTLTHITARTSLINRIVRFTVVSVGAGTTGRTMCTVIMAQEPFTVVTQ